MGKSKSAVKRVRVSNRRNIRNQRYVETAKSYVKKTRRALEQKKEKEATESLGKSLQALDRAAQKGVIHKNNAARRKSRLVKQYNKIIKD